VIESTTGKPTKEQMRELDALRKSKHRNLVGLLHHYREENGDLFIMLELCSHNVTKHVKMNGTFDESQLLDFLRQVAMGYGELRRNKIIHRDLKPGNILVSIKAGHTVFKLADFGLCRTEPAGMQSRAEMTAVGTFEFMAPEVLRDFSYGTAEFGPKADVYAIALIAIYCLTGKIILPKDRDTAENSKEAVSTVIDSVRPKLSSILKGHLLKMLEFDPKDRMTDEEFLLHFGEFSITVARNIVCFAPTAEMIVIADDDGFVWAFVNYKNSTMDHIPHTMDHRDAIWQSKPFGVNV